MVLPETLSHYRIRKKIADGGMGTVCLADDLVLERQVAIKILPADFASDAERVTRFRREARAISALNHPNIVTIHEYGEDGGFHFFVTEFLGDRTLRDVMLGRSDVREILPLAADIARGLAAAHAAGVVHRDLKPENVMVSDASIKLVDFGLAKRAVHLTERDSGLQTRAGIVMGTIPYMSPEQLRGEDVDSSTDIFSLGVLLYEWVAGRRPFEGRTTYDLSTAILTRDPPPLPRTIWIPARLETLLLRMLSKDGTARPGAETVRRELEDILAAVSGAPVIAVSEHGATDVAQVRQPTAVVRDTLPVPATPLIGREREVETLVNLLRRVDVRLVTVTGPGGTGKTRVGIEAARQVIGAFPDGVFFVALEAIRQSDLVASTIAQAIGIREQPDRLIASALADEVRGKRMLLLLDNFEQVADAASLVGSLITSAPALKFLVTSQSLLRIRNEYELNLDPLPVPPERASLETIERNAAVELFVRGAQRVKADFRVNASNARTVAEICRRLEGVPLAIELAAVRIKLFSPDAIVARLAEPISFLAGGPRDLPPRQQALRDAVGWSVSLLTAGEQTLFARLSIFEGGWSLAAADHVCRFDGPDAVETLSSLADKSLIRSTGSDDVDPRFTMLSVTRSFARQMLAESDARSLSARHLSYYTQLAEEADRGFSGAAQTYWLQRFAFDQNNFRVAINFASSSAHPDEHLRIAASLWKFWNLHGQFAEGRTVLDAALREAGESAPADVHKRALFGAGVLADGQGHFDAACRWFEKNLEICRASGDEWGLANSMNNLAVVAVQRGDLVAAQSLHDEVLQRWRALDNRPAVGLSLQNLGNLAYRMGRRSDARKNYADSLEVFRALDDQRGVALSLQHLATVDRDEGQLASAARLYDDALQNFMSLGDHWHVADCMAEFGACVQAASDHSEARALFQESLQIFRELGDRKNVARLLDSLAMLAVRDDDTERALILGAAAGAIRKAIGARRTVDEQQALEDALLPLRHRLGSGAHAVWLSGEQMSLDEAADFAQS